MNNLNKIKELQKQIEQQKEQLKTQIKDAFYGKITDILISENLERIYLYLPKNANLFGKYDIEKMERLGYRFSQVNTTKKVFTFELMEEQNNQVSISTIMDNFERFNVSTLEALRNNLNAVIGQKNIFNQLGKTAKSLGEI